MVFGRNPAPYDHTSGRSDQFQTRIDRFRGLSSLTLNDHCPVHSKQVRSIDPATILWLSDRIVGEGLQNHVEGPEPCAIEHIFDPADDTTRASRSSPSDSADRRARCAIFGLASDEHDTAGAAGQRLEPECARFQRREAGDVEAGEILAENALKRASRTWIRSRTKGRI